MSEFTGRNGDATRDARDQELSALLSSAEELQSAAKAANLEFVAYLAEMTILQIKHEIAESADPTA